ncbi:PACE efflux transporter [Paraferrimonas haliotis]|uniref:Membrane protein n=1 Tax=Paraferrimonas haliotis TaxID=2013866 RepID=A0AA37TS20_9GAMM|nr:PACE efflux transporter [Paraferrimonas haliotis]GLS82044.1 membrane protein [Paraferrimonas haliotis]
MRTSSDRLRHAIGFEVIGLMMIIPIGAYALNVEMSAIGLLGVVVSIIATVWNLIYNLLFDKAMLAHYGHTNKRQWHRIIHAFLFEFGLLVITVPIIAWSLQVSWFTALIADIGLVVFYLVYAYLYNLAYDKLFPIPQNQHALES